MLLRVFKVILAPILSLIIITLGNGLFNTLVTVRLNLEGQPGWMIGLVAGAYYAGLAFGSFRCERLITRVGHIRAYSAIASVLAAVSILQGLIVNPWADIALRFVSGVCLAGVYIVIESWMLARGSRRMRGQILGVYMMALYGSQATGQFLLNLSDPTSIIPFCIVAILSSLSVIPISLTMTRTPKIHEPSVLNFKKLYKVSAAGVIGSLVSGLLLGPIYGLMPLFITQGKFGISHIALIMSMIIYGGMALQYPVGKLSDNFDRRRILLGVTVLAVIVSVMILLFARYNLNTFMAFGFLLGGFTFTLYPLAVSLTCDNVKQKDLVAATQGLLLAYSIGAAIGPVIAPAFSHVFPQDGLFVYIITLGIFLILFLLWRDKVGRVINVDKQQDFVALTRTTPIANELDPRGEEQKN